MIIMNTRDYIHNILYCYIFLILDNEIFMMIYHVYSLLYDFVVFKFVPKNFEKRT